MSMVVDILGYREWAHELQRMVANQVKSVHVHWHENLSDTCGLNQPIFAVGWSEVITQEFYTSRPVFVLHPSPLPKYAGGSPIQHQIIAGETRSAVTIFKLDPEYPHIDSGPIAWTMPYSLEGELSEVLQQIAMIGSLGVAAIIEQALMVGWDNLALLPQDTFRDMWKRRTPVESEITLEMLQTWPAERLYNFVRALQDPYPNAFIRTSDGGRLYITKARSEIPEVEAYRALDETMPRALWGPQV